MSRFDDIAEIDAPAAVYAEGWQSWSHVRVLRPDETPPRPRHATHRTMGWRSDTPLPERGFQGEGLLAVATAEGAARAWLSTDAASIRFDGRVVSANGAVEELAAPTLDAVLAAVGERLRIPAVRSIPPGWSSWSCYFKAVTDEDVAENAADAERLDLPVEVVQIDDGWQAGIGDWLDVSPRYGALVARGRVPGIWTAPLLVGERSRLAAEHPDWLVRGLDAGENWGQRLRVLDVGHPHAAEHLEHVYRRLRELGFVLHKLDFLYAGALPGLDAYREALRIVRRGAGDDAILLGCGAPIFPSIGLVDAMRVGPDVIGESEDPRDVERARVTTGARAWMHNRLWANDPDHLVARPRFSAVRDAWAEHIASLGGVALSGDRLSDLDAHGLELTRRVLRPT